MSYFIVNLHDHYLPLPLAFPLLTASLHRQNIQTYPPLQLNITIFLFFMACICIWNLDLFKCPNKQSDSDPINTWFLRYVLLSLLLVLPSPTSSICLSPQVSSILLSKNLSSSHSPHFLRNLLKTKTNYPTTGQSSTSLSYPKLLNDL